MTNPLVFIRGAWLQSFRWTPALLLGSGLALSSAAGAGGEPVVRNTAVGIRFEVDQAFEPQIAELVITVRSELRKHRQSGKHVAYVSTPITARSGGYAPINKALAGDVKKRLEQRYGIRRLWVLAPGQPVIEGGAPIEIHNVGDKQPGGGDYMYMWSQVLAGEDGRGSDIDFVYFTGPDDFHRFFVSDYRQRVKALALGEAETARRLRRFIVDDRDLLGDLQEYASLRAQADDEFRRHVFASDDAGRQFVRYYAWCCSAGHSSGARDEWNIFVAINRRRDIGSQIPILFNGHHVPPFETNATARPGYAVGDD